MMLTPDSSPSALPEIGVNPFGNGLSIEVIGTVVFCWTSVVADSPTELFAPYAHGAQKRP